MDLILLRHGRAGDRREWRGDDRQRPLTADGVERTTAVLTRLRPAIGLDAIWTSPWTRARQTADIAAGLWSLPVVERSWLAGDASGPGARLQALVAAEPPARLLLVGHEPDLGELVGHLAGAEAIPLKKTGLAWLTGEPRAGGMRLKALLGPGLVLAIGG